MNNAAEIPIYRQTTLVAPQGALSPTFVSRVLVAIPSYNEEITIASLVLKAKKYADDVLVVNDGSSDGTGEIAEEVGAIVLSHPENRGKAAAIHTAVQFAREKGFDALVFLDGDGQHDVGQIPAVVNPILESTADLVIGSRFLNGNGDKNHVPTYRRLGQKTLDIASNAASAYKSTDTQSGFRALSRRAILQFDHASEGYNIESDMIRHLAEKGMAIVEVPITVRYHAPNGHKKDAFSHGFDILSHLVGLVTYRRPLLAFGLPGLALTTAGFFLGIYVLSIYFSNGAFHYILFAGSLVATILGLLFVTAGFILNALARLIVQVRHQSR